MSQLGKEETGKEIIEADRAKILIVKKWTQKCMHSQ